MLRLFNSKQWKIAKYRRFRRVSIYSPQSKFIAVRVPNGRGAAKFANFHTRGGDGLPFAFACKSEPAPGQPNTIAFSLSKLLISLKKYGIIKRITE